MKLRLFSKKSIAILKCVLIVLIIYSVQSCEKNKDDYIIEDKAIFQAEINGEKISLIESDSLTDINTYINWSPSRTKIIGTKDYVIDIWQLNLGHFNLFGSLLKNHISVNFVNHLYNREYDENGNVTKQQFEHILSKGTKDYSSNFEDFPGILIEWNDANGDKWTSSKVFISGDSISGIVDNTDNVFIINYSIPQTDILDDRSYYQYLDISFSCKLHNMNGDKILIRNGRLKYMYKLFKNL